MTDERIAEVLRSSGLKKTRRRMAVARMLLDSGRAATPAQVWSRLRPRLGRLGLPSVYRILEELTGAGLLTRISQPEGESELCYAACTADRNHHHHHLRHFKGPGDRGAKCIAPYHVRGCKEHHAS